MVQPGRQRRPHLVQRIGQQDVGGRFHRGEARHQFAGVGNPIVHDDPYRHPARANGLFVQLSG
jgi:hypothetical protein